MFGFDHTKIEMLDLSVDAKPWIRELAEYYQLSDGERVQTDLPGKIYAEKVLSQRVLTIKCAYCEGMRNDLIWIRYRPYGGAEPLEGAPPNDYYTWYAFDLDNYFPICSDCHPVNDSYFPVLGPRCRIESEMASWVRKPRQRGPDVNALRSAEAREQPLLLKPGHVEHYAKHFAIDNNYRVVPKSQQAEVTLNHYKINHKLTVEKRAASLQSRLFKFRRLLLDGKIDRIDFKSDEYGGAWYLFLRQSVQRDLMKRGLTGVLQPSNIHRSVNKLTSYGNWKVFDEAGFEFPAVEAVNLKSTMSAKQQEQREHSIRRAHYSKSQPQLKSISVRHYKSLQEIDIHIRPNSDEEAFKNPSLKKLSKPSEPREYKTPCLLMLGENATGKSSLLEAVTLAATPDPIRGALVDLLEGDLSTKRVILNPKYMGSPEKAPAPAAKIKLEFHRPHDIKRKDTVFTRELTIDANGYKMTSTDKDHTDLLIFAYGAHRLFGKNTALQALVGEGLTDNIVTLFRNDKMMRSPEDWLSGLDDHALNEVAACLREVIQIDGHFETIEINREDPSDPVCMIKLKRQDLAYINPYKEVVIEKQGNHIISTPLSYVSSGYRVIIALICDVLRGIMKQLEDMEAQNQSPMAITPRLARDIPVLIIIDEIEAHLHPRWKLEIVSGLRKALPNAHFIMSSHDPLCIRGMEEGEVVVFNRYYRPSHDEGLTREYVETITEFPTFENMTIEQLLTSDLFQLYSPDDRRIEAKFGNIIQLLDKEKTETLHGDEKTVLTAFRDEIDEALPVGLGEAGRLVQEAVAEFLALRRGPKESADAKREEAKKKILAILKELAGE